MCISEIIITGRNIRGLKWNLGTEASLKEQFTQNDSLNHQISFCLSLNTNGKMLKKFLITLFSWDESERNAELISNCIIPDDSVPGELPLRWMGMESSLATAYSWQASLRIAIKSLKLI